MASRDTMPVSDWKLERYRLGELPQGELDLIRERVAVDPALAERVAALARSDDTILKEYATEDAVRRIEGQVRMTALADRRRVSERFVVGGLGFAAVTAAALLVTVARFDEEHVQPVLPGLSDDGLRLKGGAQLVIVRQRQGASTPLRSGDSARAGDLLQVSYRASAPGFGAILSIDGRGSVTWHFPHSDTAAPLATAGLTALPQAYELDDAPTVERFFLVTSPTAFALSALQDAAERFARDRAAVADPHRELVLAPALAQTSFVIRKEGSR